MTAVAVPETLARRRTRCHLCHEPIVAGFHYVTKLERLGWVHAECGNGYRRVLADHREDDDVEGVP
ncbi:MAG TPA: hypothetical protein VHZ54_04625 [Solirubrobacterales bacterium]|jgi:hypothetical protein|nr:hypothetical protein [Solirubrobacterales bacterium]